MHCPKCGEDISVVDSRPRATSSGDGWGVYRRRHCKHCGVKFSTYEMTMEDFRALVANSMRLRLLQDVIGGKAKTPPKMSSPVKAIEYLRSTEGKRS
jgi:rRNA maturation protein Nop10